ncbi:metallophosphoesterase [Sinomicrobium pectinilyticum]|uniref:Metallophosphoesterase n=2 Tax=Sinomicrobium pectinilyticum TaxID=1084421 RepID=A0A3N0EJM9_SINP1|nr:metallophosphoesterase [Sinomicrobium pectinilyticum]
MKNYMSIFFILVFNVLWSQEEHFQVFPYIQQGATDRMHVLWETRIPATSEVWYGEALPDSEAANTSISVISDSLGTMHEVVLKDLKPEINYFWRVVSMAGKDTLVHSKVFSFKTGISESSDSAFMFALVGDTQKGKDEDAWERIAELIWEDRPNFVLHVGDLVSDGDSKEDWTGEFFLPARQLLSRIPMFTALGNHEHDAPDYYRYFVHPAPEYYYTFTYGNMQFFVLDTNRDVSEGSIQYNWLEKELYNSRALWKVVVHHHPPYTSEENDNGDTYKELSANGSEEVRDLVPLYERSGVDFCVFGHVHMYERTWPITGGRVNEKNGVVYINSGGGGGNLEHFAPTRTWFSLEQQSVHHYCTFAVHDSTIVFKAIDENRNVFDSNVYTKPKKNRIIPPPAPEIISGFFVFEDTVSVSLKPVDNRFQVYYTLDGTVPDTLNGIKYRKPIRLDEDTELRAVTCSPEGISGRVAKKKFIKARRKQPVKPLSEKLNSGIRYSYYEGNWKQMPDFSQIPALRTGRVSGIELQQLRPRKDYWAVKYEGFIKAEESRLYKFYTGSDDGSRLYIDDELVVDNDGDHAYLETSGAIFLEKGYHRIIIRYFESYSKEILTAGYLDNDGNKIPFLTSDFFIEETE